MLRPMANWRPMKDDEVLARRVDPVPPIKVDGFLQGDSNLLLLATFIANHHNIEPFRAWVKGLNNLARFTEETKTFEPATITYQRKLAQQSAIDWLSCDPMSIGMPEYTLNRERHAQYRIAEVDEVSPESPYIDPDGRVVIPNPVEYNFAGLAASAIIEAWATRVKGLMQDCARWYDKAWARYNCARYLYQVSNPDTHFVAPNGIVCPIEMWDQVQRQYEVRRATR